MLKQIQKSLFITLSFIGLSIQAQHKCVSGIKHAEILKNSQLAKEENQKLENYTQKIVSDKAKGRTQAAEVIYIPVVVHVVYNTPEQNISDSQIASQIEILNNDFEGKNADSTAIPSVFKPLFSKTNIKFVLANRDPDGNTTTGITRTATNVTAFNSSTEAVKKDADGGKTAWDVNKYMNMWVCSIDGTTLGYATLPGDLATNGALDGVVIRYNAFGIASINEGDNTLGRTATHEVGHWLNLSHIWGDADCGDDFVSDTPPQSKPNESNCPTFPNNANTSCTGANGEMFMNYMDYVNDACMNMFSVGQGTRMYAAINGARASLKTSTGYVLSTNPNSSLPGNNTGIVVKKNAPSFLVNPNPSTGIFTIKNTGLNTTTSVVVKNVFGNVVASFSDVNMPYSLDLSSFSDGLYFVEVSQNEQKDLLKLILIH